MGRLRFKDLYSNAPSTHSNLKSGTQLAPRGGSAKKKVRILATSTRGRSQRKRKQQATILIILAQGSVSGWQYKFACLVLPGRWRCQYSSASEKKVVLLAESL